MTQKLEKNHSTISVSLHFIFCSDVLLLSCSASQELNLKKQCFSNCSAWHDYNMQSIMHNMHPIIPFIIIVSWLRAREWISRRDWPSAKTLAQLVLLCSCLLQGKPWQLVKSSSLFHIFRAWGSNNRRGAVSGSNLRLCHFLDNFLDVFACAEYGCWCSEVGVNQSYLDHWVSSSSSLPQCSALLCVTLHCILEYQYSTVLL